MIPSTNLQEEIGWNLDCNVWDIRHSQGNSVLHVRHLQVSLQTCDTGIADISSILSISEIRIGIEDKEIITKNDRK
jgi:hypothetical protein